MLLRLPSSLWISELNSLPLHKSKTFCQEPFSQRAKSQFSTTQVENKARARAPDKRPFLPPLLFSKTIRSRSPMLMSKWSGKKWGERRSEGEKYVLKTIVISVPISRIGQLSVKLKRNLAQKKSPYFLSLVFSGPGKCCVFRDIPNRIHPY